MGGLDGAGLLQGNAVAQNQAVLVDIPGGVGADHRITPAQREVFERAALNGVTDIDIALPFLTLGATNVEVVAGNITGKGVQAGMPSAAKLRS